MARQRDRDAGGHPVFWLLLGFLCGVMAMLGGLLLLSGEVTGEGDAAPAQPPVSARIEIPALDGAAPPGGPLVLIPPPSVEPAIPIQEPIERPTVPTFRPETQAAPAKPVPARPSPPVATRPRAAAAPRPTARDVPPTGRSSADQMAEDAAASGMTARTR